MRLHRLAWAFSNVQNKAIAMSKTLRCLATIGIGGLIYYYYAPGNFPTSILTSTSQANAPKYVLADVDHGNITKSVTASGALSAIATVEVSSQVSGQMLRISADYNAEVKKGDVIAELDPLSFEIKVEQAQNELAVAEASVAIQKSLHAKAIADFASAKSAVDSARFTTEREKIALAEAKRDLERKRALSNSGSVSQADLFKAEANLEMAIQALKGAENEEKIKGTLAQAAESSLRAMAFQVVHATAVLQQRKTALKAAQVDLDRTKIRAPTNGVVIGRKIEEGQTVAVSLQTQTLFTVAQDLREMQIKISVDEADIGKIKEGQSVIYTVDAFPGRDFRGAVKQIRKDPQERQNVVTYVVVVNAPNPEKILLPGMTANTRIIIDERIKVTKVPVAALRFTPAGAGGPRQTTIWTMDQSAQPREIAVKVGLSDGKMVEVTSAEPVERVIVGIDQSAPPPTVAQRIIGSM
jgi:HlyD family secretion protein